MTKSTKERQSVIAETGALARAARHGQGWPLTKRVSVTAAYDAWPYPEEAIAASAPRVDYTTLCIF